MRFRIALDASCQRSAPCDSTGRQWFVASLSHAVCTVRDSVSTAGAACIFVQHSGTGGSSMRRSASHVQRLLAALIADIRAPVTFFLQGQSHRSAACRHPLPRGGAATLSTVLSRPSAQPATRPAQEQPGRGAVPASYGTRVRSRHPRVTAHPSAACYRGRGRGIGHGS